MRGDAYYHIFIIGGLLCEIPYGSFKGCVNKSRTFVCAGKLCNFKNKRGCVHPHHSWEAFLRHCRVHIYVKNSKLSFDVWDDHAEFNLFKAFKFPSIFDECHMIDVVDGLIQETISDLDSNDSLEHLMLNDSTPRNENLKGAMCAQFLEASQ